MTRVMGIDYGQKRIGIALSDTLQLFASPCLTIINNKNSIEEICQEIVRIAEREKIGTIVIGLPLFQDGTPSKQTGEVEKFIRALKKVCILPIATFDERYSSLEAKEIVIRKGKSTRKSKEKIDQIAAAIILQNYLNSKESEK